MKTKHSLLILIALSFTCLSYAQKQEVSKAEKSTIKTENLLDMQTNVLSSVFGEDLDGKSGGKTIGYLELIDKLDLSPEQKAEMTNIYYLQAKELNQKTKDSFGKALEQKIQEAQKRED